MELVKVNINDTEYLCPADYIDYIVEYDGTLTLSKSGSVTLYSRLETYNNSDGYPRITLAFGRTGRYITRNGSYGTTTTDLAVRSYEVISNDNTLYAPLVNTLLLVVIAMGVVIKMFKR